MSQLPLPVGKQEFHDANHTHHLIFDNDTEEKLNEHDVLSQLS